MELRHLRYFVAVAETGSVTVAAATRLHTTQPSLSRQIRDLEKEVGVPLLKRSARGIELTPAGKAFLDHARLALIQVEAATEAGRRAAMPAKPTFVLGFLTGQEIDWLPRAMRVLRDELPNVDVTISSQYSPQLADALMKGKLDVAFMRAESNAEDLTYRVVAKEPIVAVLPSDHRLASREVLYLKDIAKEKFIRVSNTAPVTRAVIDDYMKRSGVDLKWAHEADNMAMVMSLISSTRSLALMPAHAQNLQPSSVVSRPLGDDAPTVDLVVAYNKTNRSPILKLFLSRIDELIELVSGSGPANVA